LVVAEAMSAGVIPIAYGTDGSKFILEYFPDQIVPIDDVAALADRMRSFASKHNSQKLRAALRVSICERFSPVRIAEEWRALLSIDTIDS
jgi:glycosyltransferase involved in cell wall biosynthesis